MGSIKDFLASSHQRLTSSAEVATSFLRSRRGVETTSSGTEGEWWKRHEKVVANLRKSTKGLNHRGSRGHRAKGKLIRPLFAFSVSPVVNAFKVLCRRRPSSPANPSGRRESRSYAFLRGD